MKMKTSFEKKASYLKELKAELKEAEAEVIRIHNEVETRFKEEKKDLNELLDNLNRKTNEVKNQIKKVEQASRDDYDDALEILIKSWNRLVAMLNKAELAVFEKVSGE